MFTILDWEVGRYTIVKFDESCERYSIASCLSHVNTVWVCRAAKRNISQNVRTQRKT